MNLLKPFHTLRRHRDEQVLYPLIRPQDLRPSLPIDWSDFVGRPDPIPLRHFMTYYDPGIPAEKMRAHFAASFSFDCRSTVYESAQMALGKSEQPTWRQFRIHPLPETVNQCYWTAFGRLHPTEQVPSLRAALFAIHTAYMMHVPIFTGLEIRVADTFDSKPDVHLTVQFQSNTVWVDFWSDRSGVPKLALASERIQPFYR